jgi:glycosyltransferase involved in cell wall biosynthesis
MKRLWGICARECGVFDRVEFLGFVDESELAQRYAAADVFAMVSREIAPGH